MRVPNQNPDDITLERPVREIHGDHKPLYVVEYEGAEFFLGIDQMANFNPERYDASEVELGLENYPPETTPNTMDELAGESVTVSEYVKREWAEIFRETGAWVGTDPENWEYFMDGPLNNHSYRHGLDALEIRLNAESVELEDRTVYLPTEHFVESLME